MGRGLIIEPRDVEQHLFAIVIFAELGFLDAIARQFPKFVR
jgi:hypothetical protein